MSRTRARGRFQAGTLAPRGPGAGRPRCPRGGARCARCGGTPRRDGDPSRSSRARRTGRSRPARASGCRGFGGRPRAGQPILGRVGDGRDGVVPRRAAWRPTLDHDGRPAAAAVPRTRRRGGGDAAAGRAPAPRRTSSCAGSRSARSCRRRSASTHDRRPPSPTRCPRYLRGAAEARLGRSLGMKWVLGFGGNAARGLPSIHGMSCSTTRRPASRRRSSTPAPMTAERTAAVTGIAIRAFAPPVSGRAVRGALIGSGVQGHSHLAVLGHTLPGVELVVFDRHPDRASALAALARDTRASHGIGRARRAVRGRWARTSW